MVVELHFYFLGLLYQPDSCNKEQIVATRSRTFKGVDWLVNDPEVWDWLYGY
jgi:hypothetical protein